MATNLLDKAIKKAMSFGSQDDIKKKYRRQQTIVYFSIALASLGLVGLAYATTMHFFDMLSGYVKTVDWTLWATYSYKLCLVGIVPLGIVAHPQYFPLTESRLMSDEAAAMLQHCPEVRVYRDTVVASGRELCGEDHKLMMKIYKQFVKFEDSILPFDLTSSPP